MKVKLFLCGKSLVEAEYVSCHAGTYAGRTTSFWKRFYKITSEGWEGDTYVVHAYY